MASARRHTHLCQLTWSVERLLAGDWPGLEEQRTVLNQCIADSFYAGYRHQADFWGLRWMLENADNMDSAKWARRLSKALRWCHAELDRLSFHDTETTPSC